MNCLLVLPICPMEYILLHNIYKWVYQLLFFFRVRWLVSSPAHHMCHADLIWRRFLFWLFLNTSNIIRIQLRIWRTVMYYVTVFPNVDAVLRVAATCNFALECPSDMSSKFSVSYYYYYYRHSHCHNNIYGHKKMLICLDLTISRVVNRVWVWVIRIRQWQWPLKLEISKSFWEYLEKYGGLKGG